MEATQEHSTTPTESRRTRGPGWAGAALLALAAAAIGVGVGWVAFAPEPPDDVDQEIQAVLDGWMEAWDVGDGAKAVSYMTQDGMLYSGEANYGRAAADTTPMGLATYINRWEPFTFTAASDFVSTSDGPPYMVAQILHVGPAENQSASDAFDWPEIYEIVEEDGQFKIRVYTTEFKGMD